MQKRRTRCLDDIPLDSEQDWMDSIHQILDTISVEELSDIDSIPKLVLHLSLNGFSDEEGLSDGCIWLGLITWLMHLYKRYDGIVVSDLVSKSKNSNHYAKLYDEVWTQAKDIYTREVIVTRLMMDNIADFASLEDREKDKIFEVIERIRGSDKKFDFFIEKFFINLTKSIIPEDDIPEI